MVGQTTTMIYLNELREQIKKQIEKAEVGTGEVVELAKQDIALSDALKVVQGGKLHDKKEVNTEILIQQLRQIIDGLMDENKKYREMYWEYRDRVDRGH